MFPLCGAQVQSQVRELRARMQLQHAFIDAKLFFFFFDKIQKFQKSLLCHVIYSILHCSQKKVPNSYRDF